MPAVALLNPFENPGGWLTGGGGGIASCAQAVTAEEVCDDETASPSLIASLRRYKQCARPSATLAMEELEDC